MEADVAAGAGLVAAVVVVVVAVVVVAVVVAAAATTTTSVRTVIVVMSLGGATDVHLVAGHQSRPTVPQQGQKHALNITNP